MNAVQCWGKRKNSIKPKSRRQKTTKTEETKRKHNVEKNSDAIV